jgi:hypothetical protein
MCTIFKENIAFGFKIWYYALLEKFGTVLSWKNLALCSPGKIWYCALLENLVLCYPGKIWYCALLENLVMCSPGKFGTVLSWKNLVLCSPGKFGTVLSWKIWYCALLEKFTLVPEYFAEAYLMFILIKMCILLV